MWHFVIGLGWTVWVLSFMVCCGPQVLAYWRHRVQLHRTRTKDLSAFRGRDFEVLRQGSAPRETSQHQVMLLDRAQLTPFVIAAVILAGLPYLVF
jgi:hypothetical protein